MENFFAYTQKMKAYKNISPEEFKAWGKQARQLGKYCRDGELAFEDYVVRLIK